MSILIDAARNLLTIMAWGNMDLRETPNRKDHDVAWCDMKLHGMAWHGLAWQDLTWHDSTCMTTTWHDIPFVRKKSQRKRKTAENKHTKDNILPESSSQMIKRIKIKKLHVSVTMVHDSCNKHMFFFLSFIIWISTKKITKTKSTHLQWFYKWMNI